MTANYEQLSLMLTFEGDTPSNSWIRMHPLGFVRGAVGGRLVTIYLMDEITILVTTSINLVSTSFPLKESPELVQAMWAPVQAVLSRNGGVTDVIVRVNGVNHSFKVRAIIHRRCRLTCRTHLSLSLLGNMASGC